jgi:hypothetical protein
MIWVIAPIPRPYAELGQVEDAWRCIGEATKAVETRKERWCEAEVSHITGEIALMSLAPDAETAESISSIRFLLPVTSKQSPGNCALQ